MKKWHALMLVGTLPALALGLSGCHSARSQPEITKANFGYPGMKMSPGYYAVMQKMRANQGAQAAQAQARAAQTKPAAAPAAKP